MAEKNKIVSILTREPFVPPTLRQSSKVRRAAEAPRTELTSKDRFKAYANTNRALRLAGAAEELFCSMMRFRHDDERLCEEIQQVRSLVTIIRETLADQAVPVLLETSLANP